MEVADRVIVTTGAGRGLGRAIAQSLAQQGAHLALVDIDEDSLVETRQACGSSAGQIRNYVVDIADEAAVEQLFDDVINDFGRLDGLVNNAGVTRDALLVKTKNGEVVGKMSSADWDKVMDIDLRGVFLCGREAAVKMVEQKLATPEQHNGGVIINISSISRAGNVGQTNYAAAKAGVATMTTTWASELARHGIRVAAIAPGFCNTAMVAAMKDDQRKKLEHRIPVGRLGEPEEIAQTVVFLFNNDFLSGRVIEVDGGLRF